jgi:hypothetical protein
MIASNPCDRIPEHNRSIRARGPYSPPSPLPPASLGSAGWSKSVQATRFKLPNPLIEWLPLFPSLRLQSSVVHLLTAVQFLAAPLRRLNPNPSSFSNLARLAAVMPCLSRHCNRNNLRPAGFTQSVQCSRPSAISAPAKLRRERCVSSAARLI